ncbi:hypothetical protein [Glycomyces sp. NPDC048151]|uniref:hypothetical protein n=1 Tax=Glycomyces sp. NPDC048151 TaxID=3364002 RepID=UPI003721CAA6
MRRFISTNGPVLFWQLAWFTVVSLPLTALLLWLASDGTYLLRLWATGLVVIATIAIYNFLGPFTRFIIRSQRLGRLAIREDREMVLWAQGLFSFLPVMQGVGPAHDWGFTHGMFASLITWAVVIPGAWLFWVLKSRQLGPEALPPPVLPGADLVDARLISSSERDASDTVTVSVAARRTASAEEVIDSVLLLQLIPAISGGKRRWIARIDGEPVATVTQSWEHPRWWPPVEWTADPDAPFTEATVSFIPDSENSGPAQASG